MVKKSLRAQPLTEYYSINSINGENLPFLAKKLTFLTVIFFQKRVIRFVNDLKINGFYHSLNTLPLIFENIHFINRTLPTLPSTSEINVP